MKQMKITALLLAAALMLGGCGTMNYTAKGGAIGAGSGTAAGAIIGGLIGKGKGAAIGAAVGAAVGAGVPGLTAERGPFLTEILLLYSAGPAWRPERCKQNAMIFLK